MHLCVLDQAGSTLFHKNLPPMRGIWFNLLWVPGLAAGLLPGDNGR